MTVALIILDGWGVRPTETANAIAAARTPHFDQLLAQSPHTTLAASGRDVGLPDGQMGNSEVGHLNIGSGRIIYQSLVRITNAIEDRTFFANPALRKAICAAQQKGGRLHLMGLVSDGGVHSHIDHLKGLIDLAKRSDIKDVCVHAFLDGRDTPPRSASGYIEELENHLAQTGTGKIASIAGRYWAMDRDKRWERTEKAYTMLTGGEAPTASSAGAAIAAAYAADETDEFILPTRMEGVDGTIRDEDAIIFFNFRPDRARQITRAFVDKDFDDFSRTQVNTTYVCMTEYDKTIANVSVAFAPETIRNPFGAWLSQHDKIQLRIAETEKYAHVTFFFNGGVEEPWPGEDRILIPSPKVATYDLQPEMSAAALTDTLIETLEKTRYDLIVLNFANPDMVGHTGRMDAAVRAVETVDTCLGRVVDAITAQGGTVMITADHGNAEKMADCDGNPVTAHTTNAVPCIVAGKSGISLREGGRLADIAPTLLDLMEMDVPEEMDGTSLIA